MNRLLWAALACIVVELLSYDTSHSSTPNVVISVSETTSTCTNITQTHTWRERERERERERGVPYSTQQIYQHTTCTAKEIRSVNYYTASINVYSLSLIPVYPSFMTNTVTCDGAVTDLCDH